jgi:hypothetical protein
MKETETQHRGEGGYILRTTSGQRTPGFIHLHKTTKEVAPIHNNEHM